MQDIQARKPKTLQKQLQEEPTYFKTNTQQSTFLAVHLQEDFFDAAEVDLSRRVFTHMHITQDVLEWLEEFQRNNSKKIIAIRLGKRHKYSALASLLWLEHDIVPYFSSQNKHVSTEHLIKSARLLADFFDDNLSPAPIIKEYNEVIPSALVSESDYKTTVDEKTWETLTTLKQSMKNKTIRFISATPQGGGVALMRHGLIRFCRAIGLNCHWHVLFGEPEIFTITKTKIHNVLQDVAPEGTKLTDGDKKYFLDWSKRNAEKLLPSIKDSDVIVIDDPQPSGLIPHIKEINKKAKIFYRSHIQLEAKLTDTKDTVQHDTWSFLMQFLKSADFFISHPVGEFIPQSINSKICVTMPATTDLLDGLNKSLSKKDMDFYLNIFNTHLLKHQQTPLDASRPYIIQISRFDPSKGIPDVIEAYRLLRDKLPEHIRPQLVITGEGSIDDPDGIPMLKYAQDLIREDGFVKIKDDIKIAQLNHIDQLLNTLLANALFALQLSHEEGFEVKITEALMKGVPVIAYATGGIPLQIKHDENGFLVPVGNVLKTSEYMYKLITDKEKFNQVKEAARKGHYEKYQTVRNAIRWLYLVKKALEDKPLFGNGKSVDLFLAAERLL